MAHLLPGVASDTLECVAARYAADAMQEIRTDTYVLLRMRIGTRAPRVQPARCRTLYQRSRSCRPEASANLMSAGSDSASIFSITRARWVSTVR